MITLHRRPIIIKANTRPHCYEIPTCYVPLAVREEMKPEYDISGGVRGKFYASYVSRWQQIKSYLIALFQ